MPRKPTIIKDNKPVDNLLAALQFVSCVSEKLGTPFETHVGLKGKRATVFNGIVAASSPIENDIYCYAHTHLLLEALSKCSESYSLTQLDNSRLSIKSGKFKAVVPCLDPILMHDAQPDPLIAPASNKFKEAVDAVGVLASETSLQIVTASILMNGASVIATNGKMLLEYWHGLDLPPNVPLPKEFIKALSKQKKNLTGFGFSGNSATFWFEDGCWLRTQLYAEKWPDVSRILNREANLWTIDPQFFNALDAVASFSEDGNVYSRLNMLCSHADDGVGATFECNGIPNGFVYPIKQLMILKPYVKSIDYMANGVHDSSYCLVFMGDAMRGVISGRQRQ